MVATSAVPVGSKTMVLPSVKPLTMPSSVPSNGTVITVSAAVITLATVVAPSGMLGSLPVASASILVRVSAEVKL